jgi:hypothetical protein
MERPALGRGLKNTGLISLINESSRRGRYFKSETSVTGKNNKIRIETAYMRHLTFERHSAE